MRRDHTSWACARGHRFDIASSGYVNLLQPQDRRSLSAGDTKASIQARARLLAAHIGRAVFDRIVGLVRASVRDGSVMVDLGSGSGEALSAIVEAQAVCGVGIDLSTAAAELASRRCPAVTWVVANADRGVPLLTESVDFVLSQHGRRNAPDCARVLHTGGYLLVSVPAADDLVEVRAAVQGTGALRPRGDAVINEHAEHFDLALREEVRERHDLDQTALLDVLQGTYRGARTSVAPRLAALDRLTVTFSSEVCLFRRR